MQRAIAAIGMMGVLLSACSPAATSAPTATAAPSTQTAPPKPTAPAPANVSQEMVQRLTRIPSFITLKPGDAVRAFAPVAVDLPNGEAKQLDLKGMLNGKPALIYFYVMDDTPL